MYSTCEMAWSSRAADNLEAATVRQESRQMNMKMNLVRDQMKAPNKRYANSGMQTIIIAINLRYVTHIRN